MSKRKIIIVLVIIILFCTTSLVTCVYQRADMKTDMSVGIPKFDSTTSPTILFDAGHNNFHGIHTTYEPFATLLKNDGVLIREYQGLFNGIALKNIDLLIIANATASEQKEGAMTSAFSESEIHALADWIRKGGSLLQCR